MKYYFLIILFGLSSCTKFEKPFIIIDKSVYNDGTAIYIYQDINGERMKFSDKSSTYKIGDTIK